MCGEGQGNYIEEQFEKNSVDIEDFTEEQKLSVFCPSTRYSLSPVSFEMMVLDAITDMDHDFDTHHEFLRVIGDLALNGDHRTLGVILGKGIRAELMKSAEQVLASMEY